MRKRLVKALRQEIDVPIHFHTHDTAGGQIASYLMAAEKAWMSSTAPSLRWQGSRVSPANALVEAMRFSDRDTGMNFDDLQATSDCTGSRCERLHSFRDSPKGSVLGSTARDAGGQYANLYQAGSISRRRRTLARSRSNLRGRQSHVRDIVKVTPSSKVVGDMALSCWPTTSRRNRLLIPSGIWRSRNPWWREFFEGKLGQPPGGFPEALQKKILRGRKPFTHRPGVTLLLRIFEIRCRPREESWATSRPITM